MIKRFLLISLTLILFVAAAYADDADSSVSKISKKTPFVPGEVIVKFRSAQSAAPVISGGNSGIGVSSITSSSVPKIKKLFKHRSPRMSVASVSGMGTDKIDEPGVYKLTYEGRSDVLDLVSTLKANPNVEYAEPNYVYQTAAIPNDPNYSQEWAYPKIGAPSAWDVTTGTSEVVIAVIDTGVDWHHNALASHIWANKKEIDGNGIDDDNNGYIDDVRGWDFVSVPQDWVMPGEDAGPPDNDPADFVGHGTHVSGIIAGTAWNCKIMPLRAGYMYVDGGGYLELSDIAEALYYAADNGANIVNMSFGSLYYSQYLDDAIQYAHNKGCVLVAASGNVDSYDCGQPFYPAAYDNVIAVSAVDSEDKLAVWNLFAFSNFADWVDICAPGTSILSTLPGNNYGYASGTSMATPFVSGVAALLKSKHRDWTADQIEARLKATADDIYKTNPQSFLAGKLGAGRLNAKKALGNLSMAITYPTPKNKVSGSVLVIGQADIEDFKGYKLEYADMKTPNDWKPIIAFSNKPVDTGSLAIWSVDDPSGKYDLRLTVYSNNGESYQCVSGVNFGLDGEVNLTNKPIAGPSPYDPNAGNFLFSYQLKNASKVDIYVYDITGTLVWQKGLAYDGGSLGLGGSAGPNHVTWDGTNSFGEELGNGAYIYMIVANNSGNREIIGRGKFAVLKS